VAGGPAPGTHVLRGHDDGGHGARDNSGGMPEKVALAPLPAQDIVLVGRSNSASPKARKIEEVMAGFATACPPPMRSSVTTRPARRSVPHRWSLIIPRLACRALLRAFVLRERTAARSFWPLPVPDEVMPHLVRGVCTPPQLYRHRCCPSVLEGATVIGRLAAARSQPLDGETSRSQSVTFSARLSASLFNHECYKWIVDKVHREVYSGVTAVIVQCIH
jgi:hypothetical protein